MSKHTPGPWGVYLNNDTNQFEIFHDEGRGFGHMLARVEGEKGRFAANARLIAAAPDLLEALQDIVARNEIQNWFNLDKARAAIAKALDTD